MGLPSSKRCIKTTAVRFLQREQSIQKFTSSIESAGARRTGPHAPALLLSTPAAAFARAGAEYSDKIQKSPARLPPRAPGSIVGQKRVERGEEAVQRAAGQRARAEQRHAPGGKDGGQPQHHGADPAVD